MNKLYFAISITMSTLTLTACSTMNSNFDCPNKAGVMCKNLDQINSMIDSGQLPQNPKVGYQKIDTSVYRDSRFQYYFDQPESYSRKPLRKKETIQRIWIAPFEDQEGNYHQASYLYTIIKSGRWIQSAMNKI